LSAVYINFPLFVLFADPPFIVGLKYVKKVSFTYLTMVMLSATSMSSIDEIEEYSTVNNPSVTTVLVLASIYARETIFTLLILVRYV